MSAADKIRRLNRLYAVSSGINEAIVRMTDERQLFQEACRIAVERGGFTMAWVGLNDPAEGTLAPGSHGVSISLDVFNGRSTEGGSTEGSFTLTLSDRNGGTPIPLPPGVWTGLAMLASLTLASRPLKFLKRT